VQPILLLISVLAAFVFLAVIAFAVVMMKKRGIKLFSK